MIMVQITNANDIMRLIFSLPLIVLVVVQAEYSASHNVTNEDTLLKFQRLKRAPFHQYIPPDTLTAIIKDEDQEMHITWHRVKRYLVNEHLPVYTAHLNSWGPNHRRLDVMKDFKNAIMYQNTTYNSAIVYFEQLDRIFGIIGKSYTINYVSMDQLSEPLDVRGPHISKQNAFQHIKKRHQNKNKKCSSPKLKKREINERQYNISNVRNRRDATAAVPFYVETLLFVTYDIYNYFKYLYGNDNALQVLIMCYIVHFNAVDMIFANLPTDDFKLYINVAGMIVEAEDGVFDTIMAHPSSPTHDRAIDAFKFFEEFDEYADHFDFPFKKDSFDLIYISLWRPLKISHRHKIVPATHVDADIFKLRQFQSGGFFVPMTLVQTLDPYSSYCIAAHEIGHILGIKLHDPPNKGVTEDDDQCYGIMQAQKNYCSQCIKWSDESISQLKTFFSNHRNRCFLLNKPRSLYQPGTPLISLSPCGQCQCFGYGCYDKANPNECPLYIPADSCNQLLQCRNQGVTENQCELQSTIFPLDGTPCGDHKVCWDRECVDLKTEHKDPTQGISQTIRPHIFH